MTVLPLLALVVATAGVAPYVLAEEPPPTRGVLCVSRVSNPISVDAICTTVEGELLCVEPSQVPRHFLWIRDGGHVAAIGAIPTSTSAIDVSAKALGVVAMSLSGDETQPWPPHVRLLLESQGERWEIDLPSKVAMDLRSLRLIEGTYRVSATASHYRRNRGVVVSVKRGSESSIGSLRLIRLPALFATLADAKAEPLRSAVVASPDGTILGSANLDGTIAVEFEDDVPPYVEILTDGFAPHRIALEDQPGDFHLGTITLRKGATLKVRVDRSEVEAVPMRVCVLARSDGQRLHELVGRNLKASETEAALPPIEAGDYFIGVQGPTPSARYIEAIRIPEEGAIERLITPTSIAVSGEVVVGSRPAKEGQMELQPQGGSWEVTLPLDAEGAFTCQLWQGGTFTGYYFRDPTRSGTFIRQPLEATASPVHWHITLSGRTLTGRVLDKETGAPLTEVDIEETFKTDDGGSGVGILPIRADGSFVLDAIEPGEYTFSVGAEGYAPGLAHVRVVATDTDRNVEILLERGVTLPLRVVSSSGEPVTGAAVVDGLGDGINPERLYFTDGTGGLALHLKANESKTLYVLPHEGSFAIVDVHATKNPDPIQVIVPPAAGTLRVRAVAEGKPITGVTPLFRWNGRLLPPPVPRFLACADPRKVGIWTDESGVATFTGMPAGVYEFLPIRTEAEEAVALAGGSAATPVRVGFTGGTTEVVLQLAKP